MSAEPEATDGHALQLPSPTVATADQATSPRDAPEGQITEQDGEHDEEDEDEEEDEEPKLKYAKLTAGLTGVYRNGDSTSSFAVAGDKLVMGTHNGSVHVLGLPGLQGLRSWRGHSATITSVCVSPTPPPPTVIRSDKGETSILSPGSPAPSIRDQPRSSARPAPNSRQEQKQSVPTAVSNTPNNQIYIATSSLDGHVCISSLIDTKDVLLRNFARPVNAVCLSPDYKNDRTYLSGGLAGHMVLTVGGKAGISEDANTSSTAAAASGWLGTLTGGLAGGGGGKDTSLHSGEGPIGMISWSMSGKWVVWVNEEGIKIMRSHLRLGSENSEDAWKRIAHAGKPNRTNWTGMAAVWKPRCEWINDQRLQEHGAEVSLPSTVNGLKNGTSTVKSTASKRERKIEKLVVGWGDTAWLLHVHEGGTSHSGARQVGSADIIHKLQFRDCIVSGISLYTPSLVAILAYRTRDDNDKPIGNSADTPSKGGRQRNRRTGLAPQLRLVNVKDGEEVDLDELSISRFETLSAQDYHMSTIYMPHALPERALRESGKGALQAVWEASGGSYAERLFSSSASVMSGSSSGKDEKTSGRPSFSSPKSSVQGVLAAHTTRKAADAHPFMEAQGLKLVIQSPYDCVLAIKRDQSDHLEWLLEHERYAEAWLLIDKHPQIVDTAEQQTWSNNSEPSSPSRADPSTLADFFADGSDTQSSLRGVPGYNANSQKEKRRIGDLWLQQLISAGRWSEAGQVAGKVLGTSSRWEHWVWTFAQANKFDEITPYIPSTQLKPPLPSLVYEVVLGHYIQADRSRLRQLLESWDPELFDVKSIITAIEGKLRSGEVTEKTTEDGERGRDWRILMEALAKLYLADGRSREALRCYIRTQNADTAMELIKEGGLLDAIGEDIPGLLMLRVSAEQLRSSPPEDLEEASSEAVQLLREEAHRGTIPPATVIRQLEKKGPQFQLFLYFYLKALWQGRPDQEQQTPRRKWDPLIEEGHALVNDHADLALRLFAEYDRGLLMTFLRASEMYNYERAASICEQRHYIPELIYILSKTGQAKRALSLIIGELGDVKQAIAFAKENGELWDDLLDYSMGRPRFIRGLLEEVGTAIDPVKMIRRIPEGLEIPGLKDGIQSMVREYEIQYSISEGVARVLRGEVAVGMDTLRAGRKKAVRFEVVHGQHGADDVDIAAKDVPTKVPDGEVLPVAKRNVEIKRVKPGHCAGCGDPFNEEENLPLIGFACGHVYHLNCLLRANPDTADEKSIDRLNDQLGYDDRDQSYGTRSVGAKVAHAHLINNVVKGGCQYCVIPEGALSFSHERSV